MHLLKFKKYYFLNKFKKNNIDNLDNNTGIIYRNYKEKLNISTIIKIKKYCAKKKIKFFLSNNFKLSLKLKLDGVYLPSFNKNLGYKNLNYKKKFRIIGSAHNISEIKMKEKQNCEEIFLSPIFKTEKQKQYLDIIKFNLQTLATNKRIIALGGVNLNNLKRVNLTRSKGVASITWIKKNGLK